MEVIFGAAVHETKFNSIAEFEDIIDRSNEFDMESKKRGVYVEKWASPSPKQILGEDNKRQPRMKAKPKPGPAKLLTLTPEESKIAALTRLLGTADPDVRFKRRKTHKTTPSTPKISKQSSKMSNVTPISQPKDKPLRNIIEENKKNVKSKFRSNALRQVYSNMSEETISYKSHRDIVQTPSNSSTVSPDADLSDHAHWSNIFPSDRSNLLQQYICYDDQGGNTLSDEPSTDKTTAPQGKKEPDVYDSFVDLLEAVYDEQLLSDEGTVEASPKNSEAKFVIDDTVAEQLYMLEQNSRYTVKDKTREPSNQKQQLTDYYSEKSLVPKRRRRKASFPYLPPYAKDERKKRKKPNLLAILKEQLSMDYTEEPNNMYEALLTIAKQNRKRRQVYIDASSKEPSEPNGGCRFRRRNVISPSTRMPTKKNPAKDYSINATKGKYRSDTMTSDSSHSLEVLGFDYEEGPNLDSESDSETGETVRNIVNMNEGITTVTQYWKH